MTLLDDEELLPFFGNLNIQRQGARARALAAQRDVNTLPDPRTYAAVSGLLGTAPDQMGFSVLNPQYQAIQNVARPAYGLGLAAQLAPFLAPITKGLPVGASIKPINLSKGIFNPEITMQEMLRVRDIPTVERVQRSMDLVGEKKFQEMVESQFKQYKPTNQTQEAMLVESVTLDILGRANRDPKLLRGLPGLKIPAPQQAALDLAQQRAALPVEQGGLGLRAGNTAEQRAKAMGFIDDFAHGSPQSNITKLTASKTGAEGPGIYATSYFPESGAYAGKESGATVYPLKVKTDTAYQSGGENPYMKLIVNDDEQLLNRLQRMGKESIIKEQQPTPEWLKAVGVMDSPVRDHFVSMNPDLFRSRFAAFDPFRRSAAVAATMGAAAPDLLAAQQDEEMRKLQQLGLLGMVAP
jgi:hypothetical protein